MDKLILSDEFLRKDIARGKALYWRGFKMGAIIVGGTMAWLGFAVVYLLK